MKQILRSVDAAILPQTIGFDARKTIDQLNLVGLVIESSGTITYCNAFFYKNLGWKPEEIIGQNFFEKLIPAEEREQRHKAVTAILILSIAYIAIGRIVLL